MSITESVAPWYAVFGRLVQARVAILLGDGAMARTLIDEARGHMNRDLEGSLVSSILASTAESLSTVRADGISAGSLTAAELRVLQFLPSHLTFPKIGEHLFLSTNTVKTHALAIYRKLGVTSRAQAVDRARTLGLVERPVVG
jgi:LuxR family maltose regulon positive regulatory protein